MHARGTPILLDTDIGTNIDDVLCLSYLLSERRCELAGVTTTGTEPARRAHLARSVCDAFGRKDVPVFAGHSAPHEWTARDRAPWLADLVYAGPEPEASDPDRAIRFLSETIRARPGKITLITIGPLTNLARLLADHPEVTDRIGAVVSMCGLFGSPPRGYGAVETNAGMDPSAAALVFEAGLSNHCVLGLETTGKHERASSDVIASLSPSAPVLLRRLCEAWSARTPVMRFHDPMAGMCLFEPRDFVFEPATCAAELAPPEHFGRTNARRGTGPHRLLVSVRFESFLRRLFERIGTV